MTMAPHGVFASNKAELIGDLLDFLGGAAAEQAAETREKAPA
jgi:hypothetical protein